MQKTERMLDEKVYAEPGTTEVAEGDLVDPLADPLNTLMAPVPQIKDSPAPPPGDPDKVTSSVDKKLSRGLFDWKITDAEATSSLAELLTLSEQDLPAALAKLGKSGKLKRLFEEIPGDVYKTRGKDVMKLYRCAPPEILQARMKDLLSYGVFDWAVSAGEVDQVFAILAMLPQAQRDAFIQQDNGRFYDTLMVAQGKAEEARKEKAAKEEEKRLKEQKKKADVDVSLIEQGRTNTELKPNTTTDEPDDGTANKSTKKKPGFFKKAGAGIKLGANVLFSNKVDLDDVETVMGGDIGGMDLDESQGNELTFQTDWKSGKLSVDLPTLGISSINNDAVQAGASEVSGVKGVVKWRTEKDNSAFTDLVVDCMYVSKLDAKVGEDTYSISGLSIEGVHLHGEDSPVSASKPMKEGEGLKLIERQIASMLGFNLPAIKGALSASYEKPETLGDRMSQQFGSDMDIDFSVQQIDLAEVLKNGQPMVKDLHLEGMEMKIDDVAVVDGLVQERDKLKALPQRTEAQEQRIGQLGVLIDQLATAEIEFQQLLTKSEAGKCTPVDQDRLITLRNQLRVGAMHLDIDKLSSNKIDVAGSGVDKMDVEGLHLDVTGGALESARRPKTRAEILDDTIGQKYADKELIADPTIPQMVVTGSVDKLDVDGGRYTDSATGKESLGTTTLDAQATGLNFGYDGEHLSANAKTFGVDNLDFGQGAGEDYASMKTTLGSVDGEGLNFDYNMVDGAVSGDAHCVTGTDLKMPGYTTGVGSFAADTVGFGMGANGDINANGTNLTAGNVNYDDPASATHLDAVGAKSFNLGMSTRTDEAGVSTSKLDITGTGLDASGIDYKPMDVHVGHASAETFSFGKTDVTDTQGATSSTITAGGTGVHAGGVSYGKEGDAGRVEVGTVDAKAMGLVYNPDGSLKISGDGVGATGIKYGQPGDDRIEVDKLGSSHLDFGMGAGGDMSLDTPDLTMDGVRQGDTQNGKGTSVGHVDTKNVHAGIVPKKVKAQDGSETTVYVIDATASDIKAKKINNMDSGTTVNSASLKGTKLHTDGTTTTVDSKSAKASGIRHKSSGTSVGSANLSKMHLGYQDGTTSVSAKTVGVGDVNSNGVHVDQAGLTGFSLLNDSDGLSTSATTFGASGISYTGADNKTDAPDATVDKVDGSGLSFGMGNDGSMSVGATQTSFEGVRYGTMDGQGMGAVVKDGSVEDLSVHKDDAGIDASASKVSLGESWVEKDDMTVYSKQTGIGGLQTTDLKVGGDEVFSGEVTADSISATDLREKQGDQQFNAGTLDLCDVAASGDGKGNLTAGVGGVSGTDVAYKDAINSGGAGTLDVKDIYAGVSGLNTDAPSLDGLGVGSVDATDVSGNLKLWDMLGQKADPKDADTKEGEAQTEKLPGKFKAGALAKASGKLTVTLPIDVDLGWAGSLKADAVLHISAKDGVVQLSDVTVDLQNVNAYGWLAKNLVEAINPQLTADSANNLELYFEIPIFMYPDIPIWVNLVDGTDIGVTDQGSQGQINLQRLVEGLMAPKVAETKPVQRIKQDVTAPRDATSFSPQNLIDPRTGLPLTGGQDEVDQGPDFDLPQLPTTKLPEKTTTESTDEAMDEISPYVNLKRARVNLSGLQLGDGAIGNDQWGLTTYGSEEGANKIDGSFGAGNGGVFSSDKINVKDVYAKDVGGKDLSIEDVQLGGVDVKSEKLVNGDEKLNKKQKVGGNMKTVHVGGIQYGTLPRVKTP